ncbi:hypothetical protein ABIE26_001512 [Pedobacter africanus]|uniref:Uncharacterized protein n=1 Tax=Pedobacter africanus TaxID=151894 RepID=A0ACC6KRV9_9SPHI|nr:putative glycolipid-binding domain-containing protein [Pedobacter africanus]MDR6781999.1 hypothetical protein [Pedobacter africanus]
MKNTLTRIWKGKQSLEVFSLENHQSQLIGGGIVYGLTNGPATAMKYQVVLDKCWKVKAVKITLLTKPYTLLVLSVDNYNRWFDQYNRHLPDLDGCVDIDISATPFTNTLPIRRLKLQVDETQQLKVVYIKVPELTVLPLIQYYTRISERRYRYENVHTNFRSELFVDQEGLMVTYPGLFECVYAL